MKILALPDYDVFEETMAPLWAKQNAAAGVPTEKRLWAFVTENDDEQVVGGIGGYMRWDWMYVQHLIVVPEQRRKGLGRDLLYKAESLAREQGLTGIYLTTMTSQAPEFYKAAGFEVIGTIEDMPRGHGMVTMAKRL